MASPEGLELGATMFIAQNGLQDQTDRLLCCGEIGRALGLNCGCTLRLLQRSYLPGKEVRRGWVASSRELQRVLVGRDDGHRLAGAYPYSLFRVRGLRVLLAGGYKGEVAPAPRRHLVSAHFSIFLFLGYDRALDSIRDAEVRILPPQPASPVSIA